MHTMCIPGNFGLGGPRSFKEKLRLGLKELGVEVVPEWTTKHVDAILLIGGRRDVWALARQKRRGVPVLHRLDGINWVHRSKWPGFKPYVMAEIRNWLMVFARQHFANHVVYQSQFIQSWWGSVYGEAPVPSSVIYNGVDLDFYCPEGEHYKSAFDYTFLVVEGNLARGQEMGLVGAVKATAKVSDTLGCSVELLCLGKVAPEIQQQFSEYKHVRFLGSVPGPQIPLYNRGADVYISVELNAPSPNSVVEALACGTPVVGFETGALPELLSGGGGICVPYGTDHWKLNLPDSNALADAIISVLKNRKQYAQEARRVAKEKFSLETMAQAYYHIFKDLFSQE